MRQQCSQFIPHAAICTDKNLININILNQNEHVHAAQPTRVLLRSLFWVGRAA